MKSPHKTLNITTITILYYAVLGVFAILAVLAVLAVFSFIKYIGGGSSDSSGSSGSSDSIAAENFANNPITISENVLNIKEANKEVSGQHIIVSSDNLANIIDNLKKTNRLTRDTIKVAINTPIYDALRAQTNLQVLIDPYINYYVLNNKASAANAANAANDYKEGIFVCLSHKLLREEDCIWDIKGKVIAYLFMSDYLFIQALIKGYNIDINDVYIKKITFADFANTNKIFDFLFTYMVIDSEYMNFICGQRYYINGIKDVDIHRLKAYYPFIKENYNTVEYYYKNSKKANIDLEDLLNKDDSKNNDVYVSSVKSLLPIMSYSIVSSVENFITRLEMPEDYLEAAKEDYYASDARDTSVSSNKKGGGTKGATSGGYYGCYGNSEIKGKFECDSYYNIDGTPKTYYSLWDKRCAVNEDCPYYKANTNYPNNRGGCINGGFCEFPVGVKRLGFTKYSNKNLNKPLCYNNEVAGAGATDATAKDAAGAGATDTTDANKVAGADTVDATDAKKKPDYVFENDFNERVKHNLNTIITLLDYRAL
jgi:galactitol-specific phosphotransferase system IIB component